MEYSQCLNPKPVRNSITGQIIMMPCGVCEACMLKRSSRNVRRLYNDRKNWRDSLFFTLTYNSEYVPKAYFTYSFVYANDEKIGKDHKRLFAKLADYFRDRKYMETYERLLGYLPVLSSSDAQIFVRKFRQRFGSPCTLFLAGEYGPHSFRPHLHGIVSFNATSDPDARINVDAVADLLRSTWTTILRCKYSFEEFGPQKELGDIRVRYDEGTAISYTARYINSISNLPSILRKVFPPFTTFTRSLQSVCPLNGRQIRELLFTGDIEVIRLRLKNENNLLVDGSLTSHDLLRYFPFLSGFRKVTLWELSLCVRYALTFNSAAYFADDLIAQRDDPWPIGSLFMRLFDENLRLGPLKNFYYACQTIKKLCLQYTIHLDHYLQSYYRAYSNVELLKLREFYVFQKQLADDPSIDNRWINGLYLSQQKVPHFPIAGDSSQYHDVTKMPLFQVYKKKVLHMYQNSVKTKKRNDYQTSFEKFLEDYE